VLWLAKSPGSCDSPAGLGKGIESDGKHRRILVLGIAPSGQALDAERDVAGSRRLTMGKKRSHPGDRP
jgi:hypothetical protein